MKFKIQNISTLPSLVISILTAATLSACAGHFDAPESIGMSSAPLTTAGTSLTTAQSSEETRYAQQTGQLGLFALETSRIALKQSDNLAVKAFAQSEIEEQTTMAQVLTKLSPDVKKPALSAEQNTIISQMNTLTGDELTRAYINGQVTGHQTLLAVQEEYIKTTQNSGAVTPQTLTAQLARGRIIDHIKLLKAFRSGALR